LSNEYKCGEKTKEKDQTSDSVFKVFLKSKNVQNQTNEIHGVFLFLVNCDHIPLAQNDIK
jgi:hypothetical protein